MNSPRPSSNARAGSTFVWANATSASRAGDFPVWFGAVVVAGLWLLARPYIGVRHDGVLYLGQTLIQLEPKSLSHDLFFAFGSQDKFSIFSRVNAALYQALGIARSQQILLGVCHVSLLMATLLLLRPLRAQMDRWLGLAALAVMAHGYGGLGVFSFAESFVTARTVAEPLSLFAIVASLAGRRRLTIAFAIAALMAHPLMAFPALIVCWRLECERDARWRWAIVLAGLPIALGIMGVSPFVGLFQRFDPEWQALVREFNGHVFVSKWGHVDWQIVAMDSAVLFACGRLLPRPLALLCRVTLGSVIALTLVSAIGADLLGNVLISGMQLWRGLWLAHVLSIACLPALLMHLWRASESAKLCAVATALAAISVYALWPAAWAFQLWAGMTAWIWLTKRALPPISLRTAFAATSLAIAGVTIVVGARTVSSLLAANATMDVGMWLWVLTTLPVVSLPMAYGLLRLAQSGGGMRGIAVMGGVAVVMVGAALWDRRPAWNEYVESASPGTHPFAQLIKPAAQVYWPDELAATWLLLSRPSFFASQQGAGLLFNRPTAVEFARRRPAVAPLGLQRELCDIVAALNGQASHGECVPDQELIDDLCRFPQGPDFLVLPYRLARGVVAEWTFAAAHPNPRTYFLYDCTHIR
jgi:hypothetical protein